MIAEGDEMEAGGKNEGEMRDVKGDSKEKIVLMWGYLPGVSPQRLPMLSPAAVPMPESAAGDSWRDVCGGGCGFAMAISAIGEVYTWGWKECVPSGKVIGDQPTGGIPEKDDKESGLLNDQVSPRSHASGTRSHVSETSSGTISSQERSKVGEEGTKRRRVSSAKQAPESSTSGDEALSAPPCLVTLNAGVRIAVVAAGGRHTLALSDVGQVWGWGYGGEGQLGLGSRIRMVSSPHPIPCIESVACGKEHLSERTKLNTSSEGQVFKVTGSSVKAIACGGRHSAVITDTGAILTFGWGLYGQCGQGGTDDELSPKCVSSLLGVEIQGLAAGLWHTACISAVGDVYSFGGNQFGQLGSGSDQAETIPKLLEAQCLENKKAKVVSCGARHSAVVTEDGEAFCWGWNKYGQLGLGDSIDRSTPTQVPLEAFRLTNISCGWWHTLAFAESPT